jgi:hypothetical protein
MAEEKRRPYQLCRSFSSSTKAQIEPQTQTCDPRGGWHQVQAASTPFAIEAAFPFVCHAAA